LCYISQKRIDTCNCSDKWFWSWWW